MTRARTAGLVVAALYCLALVGHIYIGEGSSFAAGGVAGVIFIAYGLRAI